MKILFNIIFVVLIISSYACSGPGEQKANNNDVIVSEQSEPAISSEQTKKILEHHLTAFAENNLDTLMTDYSDESIVATADSTYKGLKPIKAFFAGAFSMFPTEGTTTKIDRMVVENELAYIVWHAKTPTVDVPLGTDTFIIENGKIKMQTFTGVINPIN